MHRVALQVASREAEGSGHDLTYHPGTHHRD